MKITVHTTRRDALKAIGCGAAIFALSRELPAAERKVAKATHYLTLSFDDGFKKSSIRTAEICEKYKLSACINVIATCTAWMTKGTGRYVRAFSTGC